MEKTLGRVKGKRKLPEDKDLPKEQVLVEITPVGDRRYELMGPRQRAAWERMNSQPIPYGIVRFLSEGALPDSPGDRKTRLVRAQLERDGSPTGDPYIEVREAKAIARQRLSFSAKEAKHMTAEKFEANLRQRLNETKLKGTTERPAPQSAGTPNLVAKNLCWLMARYRLNFRKIAANMGTRAKPADHKAIANHHHGTRAPEDYTLADYATMYTRLGFTVTAQQLRTVDVSKLNSSSTAD